MRCQNFVALSAAFAVAWTTAGCKLNSSGVRALESDDWLRDGVDRFYLAVAPQGISMEGATSDAQVGQEMLFGIGCFGEPKERNALVDVPPDACGNGPTKLPLNERHFVHQFPMASDPSKPKKGECVVLMGDEDMLAHMQAFPKDYQTGPGAEAVQAAIYSAGSTALSTTLLIQPVRQYVSTKVMGAAAAGAAGGMTLFGRVFPAAAGNVAQQVARAREVAKATVQLKQAEVAAARSLAGLNPVMQKALLDAGVPRPSANAIRIVRADTIRKAAAARTVSLLKFVTKAVPGGKFVATGAINSAKRFDAWGKPLVGGAGSKALIAVAVVSIGATTWGLVAKGQRNKNRIAFFKGMQDADFLANEELKATPEGEKLRSLLSAGNLREAAALFNPVLARKFNKDVVGTFEQGWSLFGNRPQKFFDTVKEIQAELQAYSAQTATTENPPEWGFGGSATADASEQEAATAANTLPPGFQPAGLQPSN
ncbi:MAG: hypothetical protein IOD12_07225 [Silvanigrellales bacterium]|nr:hypothetical protein [Silvanigrellales bacterium]